MLTATPLGAQTSDTAEFMLGTVIVTPVFLESNGTLDTSTEDWTAAEITATKQKVVDGMNWWVDTLANQGSRHGLQFEFDFQFADQPFQTKYEPISRISDDFELYVDEFLHAQGFGTSALSIEDIHGFNDAQREAFGTNWAVTVFVVDSSNDADGEFAPGGLFNRAFAIPNRFMIVPSERPTRIFTHEVAHIFWAWDEYTGSNSANQRRGYYDSPNSNSVEGNVPGFVQEDSIMAAGTPHFNAFANNTSAASTLAVIGWQDSDGNGVFDVLDVPHELAISASYQAASGAIRIQGVAKVGLLQNRNSEGNQSDLTLNKIDALQYRLDGGEWQTAATYGTYEASIDVSLAGARNAQTMEVRTVSFDVVSGQLLTTSESVVVPAGTPTRSGSGISGHVFQDSDGDGQRDPKEVPLIDRQVRLVDEAGNPVSTQTVVEPDHFSNGTTLDESVLDGVTLMATGLYPGDGSVLANISTTNPLGGQVFVYPGFSRIDTEWEEFAGEFVAVFDQPTGQVQLDAIASLDGEVARLEAFDEAGESLGRVTTGEMVHGERVTLEFTNAETRIKSIRAFGRNGHAVHLDHLVFGAPSTARTDSLGNYQFSFLPSSDYQVELAVSQAISQPGTGNYSINYQAGTDVVRRDFGVSFPRPWQNPNDPVDVNADENTTTTDLVNLVSDIFLNGARDLPAPTDQVGPPAFLDINGDGRVSVPDLAALLQRLALKTSGGGGGEPPQPTSPRHGDSTSDRSTHSRSISQTRGLTTAHGEPNGDPWSLTFDFRVASPLTSEQSASEQSASGQSVSFWGESYLVVTAAGDQDHGPAIRHAQAMRDKRFGDNRFRDNRFTDRVDGFDPSDRQTAIAEHFDQALLAWLASDVWSDADGELPDLDSGDSTRGGESPDGDGEGGKLEEIDGLEELS